MKLFHFRWPMFFGGNVENNLQHDSISSTTSPPHQAKHQSKSHTLPPPHREVTSAFKSVSSPKSGSSTPLTNDPRADHPAESAAAQRSVPPTMRAPPPQLPPMHGLCPSYMTPSAATLSTDERSHPALLGMKENPGCPPPPPHHPAFSMPMNLWGLQSPHPYTLPPLHHMFTGEKSFLNTAMPYLNDPLAMAAAAAKSPFFDLARMQGQYPLGKKLFGCPQCRYITDRKNNLKRHVATMHQECDKVLECCGVVFKNKASLRDHVLVFHSNGYMCRFCGRNFCRKALLKRHLTVHSGQKDYLCTLCDYATSHKSNLERHKKVHERQGTDDERDDDDEMIPETPPMSPNTANNMFLHQPLSSSPDDLIEQRTLQQRMMAIAERLPDHKSNQERTVRKQKFTSHSIADIYQENLQNSSSEMSNDDDDQNSVIDVVDFHA